MDSVFIREFNLRTSDFDCYGRLTPTAVLDLFQEVAGYHAEIIGVGFDKLLEQKMIWVVVKTKYKVVAYPKTHTSVVVKTWPLPPTRLGYTREYLIEDIDGNTLIKGTSDWVIMHSEERRLVASGNVYPENFKFHKDKNFEERTARIRDFEPSGKPFRVTSGFCDLDINGHVNNIRYANFVLNALKPKADEIIDTFQVDYHREVQDGTELTIELGRQEKELFAKGSDNTGERMFNCKITFK